MSQYHLLLVSRSGPSGVVRVLRQARLQVKVCTPGEALEHLDGHPVHAVVIDGGTKRKDDFSLVGRIKRKHAAVPVIYLAEGGSERTAVEAFRKGARDYYCKPVNLFDLRRNVLRLIALQKSAAGRRRPYIWPPARDEGVLRGVGKNIPPNLLRSLAYMEDHYDGDITLATLAEQAGMSKYHFCRVFKGAMGESPVRHLIRLRIERAKVLLGTTGLAISEVAGLVGFSDISNFSRTFKRWSGLTPTGYRRGVEAG